ncbi:hypothetical protein [Aliivibrio sp. S2MY1]|uniref:hypothetical protein n=1 Tax=Aliivibrio sp. S2MY1 TaxID=3028423 RepID=UPI00237941A9|nr:hypothetical protein [Aliivibrio sp. S2MY1]MDD9200691.1 hypothetical protein [Aliivibrio sp. S2MY1]
MFDNEKDAFKEWLIHEKKLSLKVSGDHLCRCKRLNNGIIEPIHLAVSSSERYVIALKKIKQYAVNESKTKQQQYNLTCSLIASLKKYCEFKNPEKIEEYPNGYSVSI